MEEGGLNLQPNFLKEGGYVTGPQLLEGIAGIEGVTFSGGGGCKFYIKNKLKSEIFNDKKKFTSKNIFLCHN